MKKSILFSLALSFSSNVFAGWTSGGGELIKDSNNPWFVENTKEVRYCTLIDTNNFSASEALINKVITKALDYWKKDFSKNMILDLGASGYGITKQEFIKEECTDNTDLRFQFGVLTTKQKSYLVDPTKYVGIAVRTHYDQVNLKGKGFIYISPDNGPLKFNIKEKMPNPWSQGDGGILHKVLTHELGHVFGIAHTNATSTHLMTIDFPEQTLRDTGYFDVNIGHLRGFFGYNKIDHQAFCNLKDEEKEYLQIKPEVKCIGLKHSAHTNKLHLYHVENGVYKAPLHTFHFGSSTMTQSTIVKIWLPKEQKVFNSTRQVLNGHNLSRITAFGGLPSSDRSVNKTLYIDFNPLTESIKFFNNGNQEFELRVLK